MKRLSQAAHEFLARAANDGTPAKPISYRAIEAKADFMGGLPPEMRVLAMKEVERAIDLCESPIEQVALYQIAGHNFGNDLDPMRCRVLRHREIPYYPDRLHLTPQVKFGRYRVDFLLDYGGDYLCAIECDGKDFHTDRVRDESRDKELYEKHAVRVLRAPGKGIWRDNQLIASISEIVKVVAMR